ncbi:MAG TPA: oligopeptide transporter, OPT family [Polyangiaceae bacterium]|nr:oligopeptide transporter, OPT family [Polyangiaceae bacterium]
MAAEERGRELSARALLLGAALSALLGAANAYLGLFAGLTVSAAIPAAVLSMGLLRALRGTILENNIVQTAASAGESVAAGAIFTLPALVLLGAWERFDYLWTAVLLGAGGVLGVVFSIPLRRALIIDAALPFPEGVATAEVLRVGLASDGKGGLSAMLGGSLLGALLELLEGGLGLLRSSLEGAVVVSGRVFALGASTSPALLAVGYIVGFEAAVVIAAGGLINWLLVLPFHAELTPGADALSVAWDTWSKQTRFLGVGAMTVGGLGAVVKLRHRLVAAARELWLAVRRSDSGEGLERGVDLPGGWLIGLLAFVAIVLLAVLTWLLGFGVAVLVLLVMMLLAGFLFSAVAGYMAGLVGSSNNPVSGVTIATVLLTSLALLALGVPAVASGHGFAGPAMAILVGTAVCTAAAIAGDTLQDLKSGHLLGASPAKQQIAQLVGVVTAALVLAPVLQLLLDVHGFGLATPEHPRPLRAPQASLMAAVSSGVFGGGLPLGLAALGAALALAAFVLDHWLERRGSRMRTPPLALAVGLYLPVEVSVPVALGGLVALWGERRARARGQNPGRHGLLLAAGLITGEALLGIGLSALAGARGTTDSLQLGLPPSGVLAAAAMVAVLAALAWVARRPESES